MTNLDTYRVEPHATAPPKPVFRDNSPVVLTKEQKQGAFRLGCLSLVLLVVLYLLIAVLWAALMGLNDPGPQGVLIHVLILALLITAAILSAYLLCHHADRQTERRLFLQRAAGYDRSAQERAREYKSEVGRKEKEAQALTQRLRLLLEASIETEAKLNDSLARAAHAIREAANEYAGNAFDPYWTAVEEAAGRLAAFDGGVRKLSQNARDYYESLKGRRHNFPVFPVRVESLSDPSPVAAEFCRVVRLGQTNFEFANIWEHRKLQKVVFEGFQNLGDAVNNLGGRITSSFSSLESSISAGLAMASDEQARTREVLAEEADRTRATIDARADERRRLAETQVRLLKDLKD